MWRAITEDLVTGQKYRLFCGELPLSRREFVRLMRCDEGFAAWYTQLLATSDFDAFYWEHPPLTLESLDRDTEFVLLDAPTLASIKSDPEPFRSRFDEAAEEDILVFPNLGGDAILIVPAPLGGDDAHAHLAAFLRHAPPTQINSLWRCTADAMYQNVTSVPRWLSTAGLGVAWLHVRIDTRPKYYGHTPYTRYP